MSVTFQSDAKCPLVESLEPCLCAQFAPGFPNVEAAELARHALPTCSLCRGTGVWRMRERDEPALNVANLNAAALLALLGVLDEPDHGPLPNTTAGGSLPIATMRRALIRARATFSRRAPRFTREPESTHEGRVYSGGLPLDRLTEYLSALERLCLVAQERGGKCITWA
jgi:hypothetical protein